MTGPASTRAPGSAACARAPMAARISLSVSRTYGLSPRHAAGRSPARTRTVRAQAAVAGPVPIRMQGKQHLQVTEPIREAIERKLGHAIEAYSHVVRFVDVRISSRGGDKQKGAKQQAIEITLRTARRGVVRAEVARDDLYSAIDVACDKVARSLRKLKEKQVAKGQWPGRGAASSNGADAMVDLFTDTDDEAAADLAPEDEWAPTDDEVSTAKADLDMPDSIQRAKVFYLDAMSAKEAVDRLEMVDHDFYVYLDEDSGHVQVVYKRRDDANTHGLIIPIPNESRGVRIAA